MLKSIHLLIFVKVGICTDCKSSQNFLALFYQYGVGAYISIFIIMAMLSCLYDPLCCFCPHKHQHKCTNIISSILQTANILTDYFFILEMMMITKYTLMSYVGVAFFSSSELCSLFTLYHAKQWFENNNHVKQWFSKHTKCLVFLTILGNAFSAVSLLNSGMCKKELFDMKLTKGQFYEFTHRRNIIILLLENIPLLILQLIYAFDSNKFAIDNANYICLFSILFSIMSMLSMVVSCCSKNKDKTKKLIAQNPVNVSCICGAKMNQGTIQNGTEKCRNINCKNIMSATNDNTSCYCCPTNSQHPRGFFYCNNCAMTVSQTGRVSVRNTQPMSTRINVSINIQQPPPILFPRAIQIIKLTSDTFSTTPNASNSNIQIPTMHSDDNLLEGDVKNTSDLLYEIPMNDSEPSAPPID
eukprot:305043_1